MKMEPVRVLANTSCRVKPEDMPSEALRALPMPLVRETVVLREPDRFLASPLTSEPAMESDPDIDLRKANWRVMLRESPSEPAKVLPIPLV